MTLIIALLPIIVLAKYIYGKDKNKEPRQLLAKLFIAGLASTFVTLFLTGFVGVFLPNIDVENTTELTGLNLIIHAFVGVALIEEFSKWIMIYTISYNSKEFDEIYDIIIYSVFVSLGFASLENLLYVAEGGVSTAIVRALLSIPGHTCFGVFMGYYLGLAKQNEIKKINSEKIKYLFLSIIIPTILHGIYDFCLFSATKILILSFFMFIIILYIQTHEKLNKTSKKEQRLYNNDNIHNSSNNNNPQTISNNQTAQPNKQFSNNYCPNCGTAVNSNFCPICGHKNE